MSLVTDLLAGIAEFVADVFMFRRQREKRGYTPRGMDEDAEAIARFDFVTLFWIGLVSVGVMFLLIFGMGVPVAWGVGTGVVLGAVWGYWRYSRLLRE